MTELEIKAAVRARDGFRCVDCGMTAAEHRDRYRRRLEVHRLIPGSAYSVKGTVTLCHRCHRGRHRKPAPPFPLSRLVIDTTEDVRLAVRISALKAGRTISELVNEILRDHFKTEAEDTLEGEPVPQAGTRDCHA
jgi:hypothetical protein